MGLAIEPLVAQQEEYRKTFSRRLAAQQKTSNAQATEDPAAAPPPSAPMRHLLSSDSTTEALTVALHEDPHGLLYRQDELTGLIGGFDRYRAGKGNDRQFFLSGWSGSATDYTRVQNVAGRRTLDHRHVQSPFITILGGIQPDLLGRLADEPGRNDGLTDRFLYCYPPPCPASYTSDGVSDETRRGYKAVIDRLLSPTISLEDDNAIGFTADGQDLWTELAMQHAKAVNEAPASLSGPWRKLGIYAARFALILQRARHAADPASVGQEVDDVSVHGAWQLVEYFKQQVRIVYAHLRDQAMTSRALAVFAWIVSHGGRATARHIYTYGVAACRKSEEVMTVFEWLRDMGLGDYREVSRPSGGKPTVIFEAYKPSTADHCRPERSSRSVE